MEYHVEYNYTDLDIIQNQTLSVTSEGRNGTKRTVLETDFVFVHANIGERNVILQTRNGTVAYLQCHLDYYYGGYDYYYGMDYNPYSYYQTHFRQL